MNCSVMPREEEISSIMETMMVMVMVIGMGMRMRMVKTRLSQSPKGQGRFEI